MPDKSNILQRAQQYTAKGQVDKAIEEWQKLISESPNDGNIYNTIGDLSLKKSNLPQAIEAYLKGADAFHRAGFSLKTIAVYKKLIKLAPERIDILVKLGDLNAERGLTTNAIQDYLGAAKQYSQANRVKEALEIYRKISGLDPANTNISMKLAELCLSEGLREEAVGEFTKLLEFYQKNNQPKEAQVIRQRILKLDPDKKLGAGKEEKAPGPQAQSPEPLEAEPPQVIEFQESMTKTPAPSTPDQILAEIDQRIADRSYDSAREDLDRFIQTYPEEPAGPQRMGMLLLKTGGPEEAYRFIVTSVEKYQSRSEYGRAAKLLKDFLEVDPGRIEAHRLLAEIYEGGGNTSLAVSAYARIIDEHLASGEAEPARELYSKIRAMDPGHRDVRRLRHSFEVTETSIPSRPKDAAEASGRGETPPPGAEPASAAVKEPEGAVTPPTYVDEAAVLSLLTEADVYIKYGLTEKAIEQFSRVLALDPENAAAHERLKEIYQSEGQKEKAVHECLLLMGIYKKNGDNARRAAILEEARQIAPDDPAVREASDLAPILESGRFEALLAEEPPASEGKTASGSAEATEILRPEMEAAESARGREAGMEAFPSSDPELSEWKSEADFYYQQGLKDEAKKIYIKILDRQPTHHEAKDKIEAIQDEERDEEVRKARTRRPAEFTIPKTADEIRKPRSEAKKPPVKSEEEKALEEDLDRSFAAFMEKPAISEVEPGGTADQPLGEGGRGEERESYVDLSGMVEESLREPPADNSAKTVRFSNENISEQLDDIFEEFQKDAAQPVDDLDYETHYNLGIAYREMGLLNEAILEFKQSMRSTERYIDSCNMLAACHRESNQVVEAVRILEGALSDSRCNEIQGQWIRYDLAMIYEDQQRWNDSLNLFHQILEVDRNFKDADERARKIEQRLGRSRPVTRHPKTESPEEDLDKMMERVFGETSSQPRSVPKSSREGTGDPSKKKDRISYI